jgi:hypothetical protein
LDGLPKRKPPGQGRLTRWKFLGANLQATVAEYAALDGYFIASFGGDRFPPSLRAIDGGRP